MRTSSEFLNLFVLRLSWAALTFGRLNNSLEKDMKFQDEGGLLLPPSIEQKISSTGISTSRISKNEDRKADYFQGKKYLAFKPEAKREDDVALGQMPTLKYAFLHQRCRSEH
jgi:hypothetical protein